MQEILMTPDVCMRFIVWSYYYHNIVPQPDRSYTSYNLFSATDAQRLDELKATLFRCFEPQSVANACERLRAAKEANEPCPFPQAELDSNFAREV